MAVPGYLGTTSVVVSAGSVSPDFTGVTSSGAQLWIAFRSANEPIAAPTGWTDVSDSSWGTGTAGGTDATRLQLFKMNTLADGTETTVALDDSGSSNLGFGFATDPADIDVVSTPTNAAYSTSPTFPAVTTTGADRLIFLFLANDSDADSSSGGSGATNAALASITERADRRTNVNNGGGIWFVTGEKATAGDTGTTSGTYASSASGSVMITVTLAVATPSSGTTGTGAATLAALTGAATGTFYGAFTGTGAASLAALTASASGWITLTGTAGATLPALTGAATGTFAAAGNTTASGAATLPSLTSAATGTFYGLFTGTGAASLTALTAAGAGWITVAGTGAGTIPSLTASATGTLVGGNPWSTQSPSVDIWSTQSEAAGAWSLQTAAAGTWTVQ